MKIDFIILIISCFLFIAGCEKDYKGEGFPVPMGLEKDTVYMGAGPDSTSVSIKSQTWYINAYETIIVNDTVYHDIEGFSVMIDGDWFKVDGKSKKSIVITTQANDTGYRRTLRVYLQAVNTFGYLSVIQNSN